MRRKEEKTASAKTNQEKQGKDWLKITLHTLLT